MTELINQISINGETTTFLNYVKPEVPSQQSYWIIDAITAHFGDNRNIWTASTLAPWILNIRFPVPWETKTGNIPAVGNQLATGSRLLFYHDPTAFLGIETDCSTSNAIISGFSLPASTVLTSTSYYFAVINNYSITFARFITSPNRTSLRDFNSVGWLKDGQYTGGLYPLNFYCYKNGVFARNTFANVTGSTALLVQNPSLSCSTVTPGANSTDVIVRDSTAPNNYIGKLWNMMILPSTAVVGKIYRNTGVDPDTGQVETDQKAYWMCVGTWGTDKIGMRVWTENIV